MKISKFVPKLHGVDFDRLRESYEIMKKPVFATNMFFRKVK